MCVRIVRGHIYICETDVGLMEVRTLYTRHVCVLCKERGKRSSGADDH